MEGTIRGRSFRTAARRLGAPSLTAAALALGCAGSPPPPPPAGPAQAPSRPPAGPPAPQGAAVEEREQREAQLAWCGYLEALYLRASEHATRWPKFEECTQITTMASPKMLRETADCSLKALRQFEGDPFTPAYAAEVSRCGSEAMTATTLPRSDLAPFMAAICGRVARCGEVDYDTCRTGLEEGLGMQLERAIGAMNLRGRRQLRACFGSVSCDEIGPQISACLEPIMDDLLWLPG